MPVTFLCSAQWIMLVLMTVLFRVAVTMPMIVEQDKAEQIRR